MKKHVVAVVAMFASTMAYAQPYFQASGGAIVSGNLAGGIYEIRGGNTIKDWDLSLGYLALQDGGVNSEVLVGDKLTLHTINLEAYRIIPLGRIIGKIGGGVGYSMPMTNGVNETLDNDISWTAGIGADYIVTNNFSIGLSAKGLFFRTDTHHTYYGSHTETLNTGQDVEVEDIRYSNESINLNSAVVGVNLKYKF